MSEETTNKHPPTIILVSHLTQPTGTDQNPHPNSLGFGYQPNEGTNENTET